MARDASLGCTGPISLTPIASDVPSDVMRSDMRGFAFGRGFLLTWTEDVAGALPWRLGRIADVEAPGLMVTPDPVPFEVAAFVDAPDGLYGVGTRAAGDVLEASIDGATAALGAPAVRAYPMEGLEAIFASPACEGVPLVPLALCSTEGRFGVSLVGVGDAASTRFEELFTTDDRLGTCSPATDGRSAEPAVLACIAHGDHVSVLLRRGGALAPLMVAQWSRDGHGIAGSPSKLGETPHVTGVVFSGRDGPVWFAFGEGADATVEGWQGVGLGLERIATVPLDPALARPRAIGAVAVADGALLLFTQDGGAYTSSVRYVSDPPSLGLPEILTDVILWTTASALTVDRAVFLPVSGTLPGNLGLLRVCGGSS